jgi:hypothetical protein
VLLEQYFHERGLLGNVNFDTLPNSKHFGDDPVYEYFLSLSDADQNRTHQDFRQINLLSCEIGLQSIIKLSRRSGIDLVPAFEDLSGFLEKAFYTFLNHPSQFNLTVQAIRLDDLPKRYWRRRNDLPRQTIVDVNQRISKLTTLLQNYFRYQEGRGHECLVELLGLDDKLVFYCYPEDYTQAPLEWNVSGLEPVQRRPIFDVIFVYQPNVGALDTFYLGTNVPSSDLQVLFARIMLDAKIPLDQTDGFVYELNRVLNRNFKMDISQFATVTDIKVKKFRFSIIGQGNGRYTVEENPDQDQYAAYESMEKIVTALAGPKHGLAGVNVLQVGFKAYFRPDGRPGRNTKSFEISHPHSCSLGQEGRDATLREILMASDLETTVKLKNE